MTERGSTRRLLSVGLLLAAALGLPGCTRGDDNACGSDDASELVEAAKQSPVLTQVPAEWQAHSVYDGCDPDDEFVVAGRLLTAPQPNLDRYLEQRGATRGVDADGQPCRTVLVSGLPFYVETGPGTGGTYLELRHYLTFENACRTVASSAG